MARCPNPGCGTEVEAGWKSCPRCGTALMKKCDDCGHEMMADWQFCPKCGGRGGGGLINRDGVMRANGDIVGGDKIEGGVQRPGGATVGGGINIRVGETRDPAAPKLEYEEFILTILEGGAQLHLVQARLDDKRRRLKIPIDEAERIEQSCLVRFARFAPSQGAAQSPPRPVPPQPMPVQQVSYASPPATEDDDHEPGEEMVIELPGGVVLELVRIPAGAFTMGGSSTDEQPKHNVTLARDFWLGKYPVTQAQWQAVMGENPSRFKGDSRPVEKVSWDDCQKFIEKLNARGQGTFRLPSEAEWEYACRAGSGGEYSFGDDVSRLSDYAWYDKNSGSQTHPVGQKEANDWGLYDMHGNVWEWCQDWYYGNYEGAPKDGSAREEIPTFWKRLAATGGFKARVLRGGSWGLDAGYCRAAYRFYDSPVLRFNFFGFRVARTL